MNSLFPGGFGQEIFLLQHGPVFPDDIIRQLRDICLDIGADVFLTVKLADGAGQIVFDTVISRRFVFDLALDSGSLLMQGAVQVIGVPVQQFDIFDTVLCHQIGFHTADIVFRIQVTHTGQPFRLCQVIGPGGIHLHALQHGGQGEIALFRSQRIQCPGIVDPVRDAFRVSVFRGQAVLGHIIFERIAVADDLPGLLFGKAAAQKHFVNGIRIDRLHVIAVLPQIRVIIRIFQDKFHGIHIDSIMGGIVQIRGSIGVHQHDGGYGCFEPGLIGRQILEGIDLSDIVDHRGQGADTF